jgi:hypothetical protein
VAIRLERSRRAQASVRCNRQLETKLNERFGRGIKRGRGAEENHPLKIEMDLDRLIATQTEIERFYLSTEWSYYNENKSITDHKLPMRLKGWMMVGRFRCRKHPQAGPNSRRKDNDGIEVDIYVDKRTTMRYQGELSTNTLRFRPRGGGI